MSDQGLARTSLRQGWPPGQLLAEEAGWDVGPWRLSLGDHSSFPSVVRQTELEDEGSQPRGGHIARRVTDINSGSHVTHRGLSLSSPVYETRVAMAPRHRGTWEGGLRQCCSGKLSGHSAQGSVPGTHGHVASATPLLEPETQPLAGRPRCVFS